MDLKQYYSNLYNASIINISKNEYDIDTLIDSPDDKRFGITLLFRPSSEVKDRINGFLKEIKKIEPFQYYYPESDIHITVLSIISCYNGFDLSHITLSDYDKLIRNSISSNTGFNIDFKGITASSSCVMIQGFPQNDSLKNIRNNLRNSFKKSDLEHSIDKRYEILTAHSTIVRLKERLSQAEQYISILNKYKDYDFGSFEVKELELVYNDWYQRAVNSNCIKIYVLS